MPHHESLTAHKCMHSHHMRNTTSKVWWKWTCSIVYYCPSVFYYGIFIEFLHVQEYLSMGKKGEPCSIFQLFTWTWVLERLALVQPDAQHRLLQAALQTPNFTKSPYYQFRIFDQPTDFPRLLPTAVNPTFHPVLVFFF